MARISTYPLDTSISEDDLLVGTDAEDGNITKNFKISALAEYFGPGGGSAVSSIIAGAGISISPSNGKGNVTISAPTAPQWLTSDAVVTNGVVNYVSNLLIPTGSTSIGDTAFSNMNLDAVDFNNQAITNIGAAAFAVNKLKGTLTLPSTLLAIGDYAFQAFNNASNRIELIEFGNQLTTIGIGTFWRNAITSLSIPSSVTAIGTNAFRQQMDTLGTKTLTSLTFESRTTALTLSSYAFDSNAIASVNIPSNTTTGSHAFAYNDPLSSVTIGDNSTIGQRSFYYNESISSLTIGDNVNLSNDNTFGINTVIPPIDLLTSVNLPSTTTFTTESGGTFTGRRNLTTFTVANGANSFWPQTLNSGVVPSSMFLRCGLTEVSIDSNVTVGDYAFSDNLLTSISIGENVTLNSNAFYSNPTGAISTLTIPGTTIFPNDSALQFANINITNLIIEEGITEIPSRMCTNAGVSSGVTNVTFPSSVVLINSSAFSNNNISGTLTFASVITIAEQAFENNPGITTVNVPIGSTINTNGSLSSFDSGVTINYV